MSQFGKLFVTLLAVAAVGLAAPPPAHAAVNFTLGNNPQPDEDNVLLHNGTTGNPVFGVTNTGGITVGFGSATDILTEPSGGQARVGALDGNIEDLSIFVPGGDYTDLIMNPFLGDSPSGPATVDVLTNMGTTTFIYPTGLGSGNNFLTIVASGGEKILNTDIIAPAGFGDLGQPRISGAELVRTPVVPEPCTLSLLGLGGLPLFGRLRRRSRKA
jgi:hypothetical protein